jgi:hypothetical protein
VGRKVPLTSNSTIAFIKDRKRDAFYFINEDLTLDEKTFVEAAQIFECHATEKAKPCTHLHHAQIEAAIGSFHTEQQVAALGERASSKLGPNEQKALHFVNQNGWQEYATTEDKLLMDNAKVAIRTGRFQKLPREINQLLRTNKLEKMDRHLTFAKLMTILRTYPLLEVEEEGGEAPRAGADKHKVERSGQVKAMPQVIISESFV